MDPAVLQKTVDDFNQYAAGAAEDPFGRTLYSTELKQGPWVLTPRQVSIHHTMGGIHGANRLGGNAVADFTVFGRIAGVNAAAYAG
jgi:fumarate reductase flavoprotein subunit